MSHVDTHTSEFTCRGDRHRLCGLLATANERGNGTEGRPEAEGKSEGMVRCGKEERSMGS